VSSVNEGSSVSDMLFYCRWLELAMYLNSSHDAYLIEEESDEECAER